MSLGFIPLVTGGRGAGCPGRFILSPTWVLKINLFFCSLTCFKISEYEVDSFIIHNSSKMELFSLLFGYIPLVAGVVARCPGRFILPPPT